MEQILRNLLANAFKFTDAGGVSLAVFRLAGQMAFQVADTGIGVPEEKQEMIFETFRQADGATSRKYGGTGLGLAISRKYAQLLQGGIQVESQVGGGTAFTVLLPELSAQVTLPASSEATFSVDFYATWATILIVDDDAHNRFALTTILTNRVKSVLSAANGVEALNLLNAHAVIDLVLMDIMMPVMDGFQAIQAIRQRPDGATVPIVAVTAKVKSSERERCLQLGANDYLTKPVQMEHLFMVLEQWLPSKPDLDIANHWREGLWDIDSAPAAFETMTPLMIAGYPVTLIVAEDDMRTAYSIAKGLQARVENVLLVVNGAKLLKELALHPEVDAILMDMRMPEMDGYETMRRIRADQRFCHLPILAMTALTMPGDAEKCLDAGADCYLAKPVEMNRLWNQLEQLLAVRIPKTHDEEIL